MKKTKNMFRGMRRKRDGTEYMKNKVKKNYREFNINNGTKKRLGLDKKGSKGNSGPYQADTLTTNEMTEHFNKNEEFQEFVV